MKGARLEINLNDTYEEEVMWAFRDKFGLMIDTSWSYVPTTLIHRRNDGEDFTDEQLAWLLKFVDKCTMAIKGVECKKKPKAKCGTCQHVELRVQHDGRPCTARCVLYGCQGELRSLGETTYALRTLYQGENCNGYKEVEA